MPNITLRKSDKVHALEAMIKDKFLDRYKSLEARQKMVALRVYNETYGKTGNQLKLLAGPEWRTWLRTKNSFYLKLFPAPCLIIEGKKAHNSIDLFTGKRGDSTRIYFIALTECVVWPEGKYTDGLDVSDATKATQKVAETLKKDITKFNEEAKQFYSQAYSILMQIRSSKKVDDMFPELWDYLPTGTKERVKQALVISQSDVDALRSQLSPKAA